MKPLVILILALIPFMSGCKEVSETDSYTQIREIAWNSLCEQEKATVIKDWRKASVTEETYKEKSSYAVIFNTSDDAVLGPIIVYIDKTSLIVLGHGLRA